MLTRAEALVPNRWAYALAGAYVAAFPVNR